MRHRYRFTPLPSALRKAKLDNLALVPGNLLPYKKEWQALANRLPHRGVLILLPRDQTAQQKALLAVAKLLAAAGHQVKVLLAADVQHRIFNPQEELEI